MFKLRDLHLSTLKLRRFTYLKNSEFSFLGILTNLDLFGSAMSSTKASGFIFIEPTKIPELMLYFSVQH